MSSNADTQALRGRSVNVGLSSIIGVSFLAGSEWNIIKYSSGGSLEIGGISLTWAAGYLYSVNEVLSFPCNGSAYLAATGATVVVQVLSGLSAGNL